MHNTNKPLHCIVPFVSHSRLIHYRYLQFYWTIISVQNNSYGRNQNHHHVKQTFEQTPMGDVYNGGHAHIDSCKINLSYLLICHASIWDDYEYERYSIRWSGWIVYERHNWRITDSITESVVFSNRLILHILDVLADYVCWIKWRWRVLSAIDVCQTSSITFLQKIESLLSFWAIESFHLR